MGISTVTRNYQVTIPKYIRLAKRMKVGDNVVFVLEGDDIHLVTKTKEQILEEARGILKDKIRGSSVEYVRKMRAEWEKRRKRLGL